MGKAELGGRSSAFKLGEAELAATKNRQLHKRRPRRPFSR
jgi:hypothetical protein